MTSPAPPDPLYRPRVLELTHALPGLAVLWRRRDPRTRGVPAALPGQISTQAVPGNGTRGPLWCTLLSVPELTELPAQIGRFEGIVSHTPLDLLPHPHLPRSWLAALASAAPARPQPQQPPPPPKPGRGARLHLPLRGLGWLKATNSEDNVHGELTGHIKPDPDAPLHDLPDSDLAPATLARLRTQRGTAVAPHHLGPVLDLAESITALKVLFPDLRHHLHLRPDLREWHLYRDRSGQWARVTIPARSAPTVTQGDRSGLWELLADWTARWTRCMDPASPAQARVRITPDGRLDLYLSSSSSSADPTGRPPP